MRALNFGTVDATRRPANPVWGPDPYGLWLGGTWTRCEQARPSGPHNRETRQGPLLATRCPTCCV